METGPCDLLNSGIVGALEHSASAGFETTVVRAGLQVGDALVELIRVGTRGEACVTLGRTLLSLDDGSRDGGVGGAGHDGVDMVGISLFGQDSGGLLGGPRGCSAAANRVVGTSEQCGVVTRLSGKTEESAVGGEMSD